MVNRSLGQSNHKTGIGVAMEEWSNQCTPVSSMINRLKFVNIAEYFSDSDCCNSQSRTQEDKIEPCIGDQPGYI